jgi:hypothetical protein
VSLLFDVFWINPYLASKAADLGNAISWTPSGTSTLYVLL